MKKQLCKCRGTKSDGTGYTDCTAFFILDNTESCPKCGSIDWYEVDQIEIPEENECAGCEHYGGMKPDCMAPSFTPCPKEMEVVK